jgi:CRP/FNR family transcriptional regulator
MPRIIRSSSIREGGQSNDSCEADTTDELLHSLQRLGRSKTRRFDKQETIYREGENAETVFHILHGMVKLLVHLPNGKVRIVRLQVTADWLALEGLGKNNTYEHEAVAVSEVEVVQFPAARLCALEEEDCDLYVALLKLGYDHLEKADKWIAEFSTGSIKARLAHLIEFLGGLEVDAGSNMINLMTVNETADVLGVTPESVSRFLAEFKRNKVLIQVDESDNWLYRIDHCRLDEEKKL